MKKVRLEAFSDGVIAIIITIMVLELHPPQGSELSALAPVLPRFSFYLMSFVFLGVYWNNHHHLLQAAECVNGRILWANLHLLFWLSLVPFVTSWMGANPTQAGPVACYGVVLLFSGFSFFLLTKTLVWQHGKESPLAKAIGSDTKGIISMVMYLAGILFSNLFPLLSQILYVGVTIMWLIPDRRIEKVMELGQCE